MCSLFIYVLCLVLVIIYVMIFKVIEVKFGEEVCFYLIYIIFDNFLEFIVFWLGVNGIEEIFRVVDFIVIINVNWMMMVNV